MKEIIVISIVFIISIIFILTGFNLRTNANNLIKNGIKVSGTVVGTDNTRALNQLSAKYRKVQFTTTEGQVINIDTKVSSLPFDNKVNYTVPVIYDKSNPNNAMIDSFKEIQLPWILCISIGSILSVICIIISLLKLL